MSSAVRRYSGEFDDPISVKVNVVTEKEVPLSVEPQIVTNYKRGEYVETWNKTFFMTDLSNVQDVFNKLEPESYGLTLFNNVTSIDTIEINFTGNTGKSTADILSLYASVLPLAIHSLQNPDVSHIKQGASETSNNDSFSSAADTPAANGNGK